MTLTHPMKAVLAAALLVLMALGFWLMDWQGKVRELEQARQARAETEANLERTLALVAEMPQITREKQRLERELATLLDHRLPGERAELFVPHFLKDLEALAADQGRRTGDPSFALVSVTPGELARAEGETMPSRLFQVALRGRYETLVDFLGRLGPGGLGRPVTLNRITLSPVDAAPGSPVLSISLPMTAYSRQGGS